MSISWSSRVPLWDICHARHRSLGQTWRTCVHGSSNSAPWSGKQRCSLAWTWTLSHLQPWFWRCSGRCHLLQKKMTHDVRGIFWSYSSDGLRCWEMPLRLWGQNWSSESSGCLKCTSSWVSIVGLVAPFYPCKRVYIKEVKFLHCASDVDRTASNYSWESAF